VQADLSRASVGGGNLEDVFLGSANLTLADLGGAGLRRANLADADLRPVSHFADAKLIGVNFRRADLRGVVSGRVGGLPSDSGKTGRASKARKRRLTHPFYCAARWAGHRQRRGFGPPPGLPPLRQGV
jgi:hypothetical protein